MKNLTLQLRTALLLTLILLACTAAYSQITPLGDSYINTAKPTTNYGAATTLDVDGATQTTYIQFNLASVPATASVSQATLKLYVNSVTTAGSFNVDYVNGSWAEGTIDSSNAPPLGAAIASNVDVTTADKNQYILVNVTSAVQAWLNGSETNNGLALVANSSFNATFDSKENTTTSHPAELDIAFAGGDGTITGITTDSGSGLTGGGTSGTLNLSLTNGCAANQVLQYNGSSWVCAAVGTGTITGVTAGTDLTGGGTSGNVTLNLNTAATNALYAQLGAANTFTGNQTLNGSLYGSSSSTSATVVEGIATAATGSTTGVFGATESTSGVGVNGLSTATSGVTVGVVGGTNSPAGYGVYGSNSATTGTTAGVWGATQSTTGYGVEGQSPYVGVFGNSPLFGVWGDSTATTGTTVGVVGDTYSTAGYGVLGASNATTGTGAGVYGVTQSTAGYGVLGTALADWIPATSTAGEPYGVVGASATVGVYGQSSSPSGWDIAESGVWGDGGEGFTGVTGTSTNSIGVNGTSTNWLAGVFYNETSSAATLYAENDTATAGGVAFQAALGASGATAYIGDPGCGSGFIALQLSQGGMSDCDNYTLTGASNGESYLNAVAGKTVHLRVNNTDALVASNSGVSINGTLSATGTKNFRIDHPLDPANKYLSHAAIEVLRGPESVYRKCHSRRLGRSRGAVA
jgi:hypothetical protein